MRAFTLASAARGALVVCALSTHVLAQDSASAAPRAWYDRLSFRGYAQFRYNRLLETNEKLKCLTCDRSIGNNGGFFLRRARLIVSGDASDRVSFALQTDFSSEVGGRENTVVLRQYYADIWLDAAHTVRARVGQSGVPTGFETLQSSSRRAPFDRADALDSSAPGEQDLGVYVYWTPRVAKQRFRALATQALKGSGDYGVIALGAFNGQGGNRAELNDAPHVVVRAAYPFLVRGQYVELAAHAYTGTYTISSTQRAAGVGGRNDFTDRRVGAALIVYPQPLGLQAEWSAGRGPQYDAAANAIAGRPQRGGYTLISYSLPGHHHLIAYGRAQYFHGAYKTDPDARSSVVHEYEPGLEWAVVEGLEFTAAYAISNRHYRDSAAPDNHQRGRFLRLQAQFSF